MPAVDINRGTTNVLLHAEVSSEIWGATLEESAFMRLARRINMPGNGVDIQTITGEPTADWVDETALKPVSTHTFGKKTIRPYKLAVIEPFSNEFRRDKAALYNELINRLPFALAKKFDSTIMGTTAPGTGFDVLGGATKVSLNPASGKTVYDQFITIDGTVAAADGIMNGIALAPQGKSKVLAAQDAQQRPLFTPGVESNTVGDILGAPVYITKGVYVAGAAGTPGTPAVVGVAGDFSDAVWGSVEGIQMAISDQATLAVGSGQSASTINLWQQNMFAVRVEIEIAVAVKNINEFVLLTGDTPSA
jgi:HK97 family phage major capsid protein